MQQTLEQDLGAMHTIYCTWYNSSRNHRLAILKLVPASTVIGLALLILTDPLKNGYLQNPVEGRFLLHETQVPSFAKSG